MNLNRKCKQCGRLFIHIPHGGRPVKGVCLPCRREPAPQDPPLEEQEESVTPRIKMMTMKQIAYRDGQDAKRDGIPVSSNPYHSASELAPEWRRGWGFAQHPPRVPITLDVDDPEARENIRAELLP